VFPTEKLLKLYDKFNSRNILNNFSELLKGTRANDQEIKIYQANELKFILDYAINNSPFYRETLGKIGLQAKNSELTNFNLIPVLYKGTIKNHLNELISREFMDSNDLCFDYTGGSSGQPLKFAYDKDYKDFRWAMIYFNLFLVGYQFGDRHGFIYGSHYDSKKQYSLRQRLQSFMMNSFSINAFFLNNKDLRYFVKKIKTKKPKFLIGYASALMQLAKYVRENGFKIKLDFVESTSEYLAQADRDYIEGSFGCDVYDRYGCREVGNIAHECKFKNGMHINWQSIFVEIVNKGAYPWLGEDYGDIVITSLKNKGMPFIRYFLGDIGKIDNSPCECGMKNLRLFLGGARVGDLLISSDGGIVSSPALTLVYKDLKEVERIQFVQPGRDELRVRLVKGANFNNEQQEITQRLKKIFGKKMNINFDYVENIEKEPSGKYRIAKRLFNLNENTISK